MGPIERSWAHGVSRRTAIAALGGLAAGAPSALQAQIDPRHFRDHRRAPGLPEMRDAYDFEEIAFANLPRQVYDYTAQGANGEWTARRNRHAFEWVDRVQSLLHLVHEELARNFGMLGVSTPAQLTRDQIRIHRIATA